MKKNLIIYTAIILFINSITTVLVMNVYWQHLAIVHHSAFYESDSWGITSFHWNDVSFAQAPFQEEGWISIQNRLFNKKMDEMGLK